MRKCVHQISTIVQFAIVASASCLVHSGCGYILVLLNADEQQATTTGENGTGSRDTSGAEAAPDTDATPTPSPTATATPTPTPTPTPEAAAYCDVTQVDTGTGFDRGEYDGNNHPFANYGESEIDGTSADSAWSICTSSQLNHIGANIATYKNKYFELKDNLDLSGVAYNVIGTFADRFSGEFDGNGKTISNLTINAAGSDYKGLFGYVSGGSISDLVLSSVSVTGRNSIGAVVGIGVNMTISSVSASNVTISGAWYVGGLIGFFGGPSPGAPDYASALTVISGTVTGSSAQIGGLIGATQAGGENFSGVRRSYSSADVVGTGASNVGGLIGGLIDMDVSDSYATGNVTANDAASAAAGGLVGSMEGAVSIARCYATGDVLAGWSVGGFMGFWGSAAITDSFSTGDVTEIGLAAQNGRFVGGGTVAPTNSYYLGSSTCNTTCSTNEGTSGGNDVTYFYDKDNAPLSSWDFTNIWRETDANTDGTPDGFPTLR